MTKTITLLVKVTLNVDATDDDARDFVEDAIMEALNRPTCPMYIDAADVLVPEGDDDA